MGLSVRIVPMERSILATIRADLSPAMQKKAAAEFARIGINDAKATNRRILGRDPPLTITVDGRKNAALESVNPDGGTIIAEFELRDALLAWIGAELVARSPFTSGAYVRGHKLFAGGTEVIPGEHIPDADEYVFTNVVPYARRLEVGKTKSGRPFLIQVPNHIYERVAKDARARFGNQADIKFAFREPLGSYKLQHDQPSRDFSSGVMQIRPGIRADRRRGSPVIPPAIVIRHKKS
jgi:hypothetical protein